MKMLSKGSLGAAVAAVALVSTAAPAEAQYRDRDRESIDVSEIISGEVVLRGLAAVLSAGQNARYQDGYDDDYSNHSYSYNNSNGSSRAAINQCINRVENKASGYNRSNVTQIRSIERTRNGYRVQGVLDGQNGVRGNYPYNRGDRYGQNYGYDQGRVYDQQDRYDRNGYGRNYDRGYEGGQFTCYVERGRVIDIDYDGANRRY